MQGNSNNWDSGWDCWNDMSSAVQEVQPEVQTNWRNTQTFTNSNRNWNKNGGGRGRGGRGRRGFHNENPGRGSNDSTGWGNNDYSGRGSSENSGRGNNDKCELIKIPSRLVGRVIGRGGSKIEEIQMRSSARVQVTKDVEDDSTFVKIFGNDQQIARAKEFIDEVTEERPKREESKPITIISNSPLEGNGVPVENPEPKPEPEPFDWRKHMAECDALVEAEWNKLPPIIKCFYQEHPEVTALTDTQVEKFRQANNNIVVDRTFQTESSKPIPKPVLTFQHAFHNYPEILEEIRKAGFEEPSPIQSQAWPVLLSGEDLIGIAQTGTGKTLAFLLPAFIHIDGQTVPREERGGPAVLVMAPTRELALQIDKEVKKYSYRGITSVCVYGGGDRKSQVEVVSRGVDIVIATPGRMNDLNEAGHLNVRSVTYVVLDEADRMLDMGFEPQIRKVMYSLRPTKQCVMTSATWPACVRRLAESYMKDPVQVYVGSLDLAAVHSVTQVIELVDEKDKEQRFMDFARHMAPDEKIIVFCGTKARADYLSVECAMLSIPCTALHGNRDQSDREQAVKDISNGTVRILIATDVASRGLDIDDVTHVLNYDFPKNIEEYVHRVGRTGRAGKSGESISYFTRNDWGQAAELIKILEEADQFVPEELVSMAERFEAMKERKDREGVLSGGQRKPRYGGSGGGRRW